MGAQPGRLLTLITAFLAAWCVPDVAAWPVMLGDEIHSSPIVADVDHDGTLEIAVFSTDAKLHLLTPEGLEHSGAWPVQLGPPSSIADGQNWVSGSAAIVNIDSDPDLEILQATFDGKLHALTPTGVEEPGFPISMGSYSTDTPTVADLDLDDDLEIVCRYNPNSVGLWSHKGALQPGWPRTMANAPGGAIDVWSSAALGDLDGDHDLEIIMGGYDGYAHAFHHTGDIVSGWPVDLNPSGGYTGWVLSSPACADFDDDGRDEVVIGCDDDKLYVLKGDGTSFIPGVWPRDLPFGFRASPACADLDGDGDLEIVIGHRSNAGDMRLYAIHHTGVDVAGWPIIQSGGGGGYTFGWLSPLLADLDGDHLHEVIAVKERSAVNPNYAEIYAFGPGGGPPLPGFPIPLEGLAYAMPTVCDLDGDGLAELLIGDLTWQLYRFDLAQSFDTTRDAVEWPRFQKDLGNTGRFVTAPPVVIGDPVERMPRALVLHQNYPNPFNPTTTISFEVPATGAPREHVSLAVYDVRGRRVKTLVDSSLEPGHHSVVWEGRDEEEVPVPSGIYIYTMKAEEGVSSRKMVLLY